MMTDDVHLSRFERFTDALRKGIKRPNWSDIGMVLASDTIDKTPTINLNTQTRLLRE
jgi:hypothetical protein